MTSHLQDNSGGCFENFPGPAAGLVLLASTSSFAQTVTIVSPVDGPTTSPVRVVADFSDTGAIAATMVLVDGAEVSQGGAVTPLDVINV